MYVAGPYSPNGPNLHDAVQEAHQNTLKAIAIGIALIKKGHIPFIPHLMHFVHMQSTEPLPSDYYREYDMTWLPFCDALFYIGSSTGADAELKWAQDHLRHVFKKLDEVPDAKAPAPPSPAAPSNPVNPAATAPSASEDTRIASKDALKTIYAIIVGLAITQSLRQAFFPNNVSLGYEVLLPRNFRSIILLFAFIPTVVRFAHGAYIHLGVGSKNRYRPIADFGTFLLQGVLFFLMALSLNDVTSFLVFFAVLLLADAVWLLVLKAIGYMEPKGNFTNATFKQWIVSDAVLAFVSGILIYLDLAVLGFDLGLSAVVITVAAIAAAALDYWLGRDFYFPNPASAPSPG